MAKIPDSVKAIIDKYIEQLKINDIPLKAVYLFGSYAKGNFNEWSDIDIALVFNIFEGNRINDRDKIRKITLSVSSNIEVLPFNPTDFTLNNPLAREIIENGSQIA